MTNPESILCGENLKLGYQKGKETLLVAEGISFELYKGKLTCLLGPNGVGKSTLLKAIMGQNAPLSGSLKLENRDLKQFHPKELAKKTAMVLTEKITLGNLTAAQLIALGRVPHTGWFGTLQDRDKQKIEQAILATKTGYLRDRRLSELSDGQLQKIMIARALAQDGELVILDEPTAHLDLINRYEIMHLLRDIAVTRNKAILVVTHDLEIAIETADQFWIMQCGFPMTMGTPEDLVINGQINLLLPDKNFNFDINSGKVRLSENIEYPEITGSPELVQWVKLALRKLKRPLSSKSISIEVNPDPLSFLLNTEKNISAHTSIAGLLQEINRLYPSPS